MSSLGRPTRNKFRSSKLHLPSLRRCPRQWPRTVEQLLTLLVSKKFLPPTQIKCKRHQILIMETTQKVLAIKIWQKINRINNVRKNQIRLRILSIRNSSRLRVTCTETTWYKRCNLYTTWRWPHLLIQRSLKKWVLFCHHHHSEKRLYLIWMRPLSTVSTTSTTYHMTCQ